MSVAAAIFVFHSVIAVQQHYAPVPEDGPVFDTEVAVLFDGQQIPVTRDDTLDNLERIFRLEGRDDLAGEVRGLRSREDGAVFPCCTLQLSACMVPALFVGVGLATGIAVPFLWAPAAGALVWTIIAGLAGGTALGALASVGFGASGFWWLMFNAVDYWDIRVLVDRFNRTRAAGEKLVLTHLDTGDDEDDDDLPGEQLY